MQPPVGEGPGRQWGRITAAFVLSLLGADIVALLQNHSPVIKPDPTAEKPAPPFSLPGKRLMPTTASPAPAATPCQEGRGLWLGEEDGWGTLPLSLPWLGWAVLGTMTGHGAYHGQKDSGRDRPQDYKLCKPRRADLP
ncbi:hypothetical protein NDU88_006675 [Pleurodeles waltl]|uniref:Uncharacterized protein n=1 Tax=Pleurodeles waltl TaxID=8319 RepID=A0AAV7TYA0_PLEWA|nr:hypothetical protein NDU88_006675 [Pleurodeles waltl]